MHWARSLLETGRRAPQKCCPAVTTGLWQQRAHNAFRRRFKSEVYSFYRIVEGQRDGMDLAPPTLDSTNQYDPLVMYTSRFALLNVGVDSWFSKTPEYRWGMLHVPRESLGQVLMITGNSRQG